MNNEENRKDILQTRNVSQRVACFKTTMLVKIKSPISSRPKKWATSVKKKQVTMKSTKTSRAHSRQGDLGHGPTIRWVSGKKPGKSTKHGFYHEISMIFQH